MSGRARDMCEVPICVDGRMLGAGGTGVSTYARPLTGAIARISDRSHRLIARNADDGRLTKWMGALRRGPHPVREGTDAQGTTLEGRDLFRRAHVHFDIRRQLYPLCCDLAPGIMHWTYPVPIVMEGWINLYTVHDAIPLDRPDLTPIDSRRHRAVLDAIAARGDRITTVSQSARAAIVAALGCDPDFVVDIGQPVSVAGVGAGPALLPAELTAGGYLLMVGSVEPRKNLTVVLDAYRRAGIILPLVVAGPDGWRAGPILADIAATPGVVRLPYVERDTLLALIRHARALVFPSLAEGFGLPMAEAMALGTPVLTSDRGALAEIAGGAALTVDPTDVGAIGNALAALISDTAMATALSRAGLVRAAAFSPDRFAERLQQLYRDALRVGGHEGNGSACHGQRR